MFSSKPDFRLDAEPLGSYNSLMDPHLTGFFSNTRVKRHLRRVGLITRHGEVVSEATYRFNMTKRRRDLMTESLEEPRLYRRADELQKPQLFCQGDSLMKTTDRLPRIGRTVAQPSERNEDEMLATIRSRSPTSDETRASSAPPDVTEQPIAVQENGHADADHRKSTRVSLERRHRGQRDSIYQEAKAYWETALAVQHHSIDGKNAVSPYLMPLPLPPGVPVSRSSPRYTSTANRRLQSRLTANNHELENTSHRIPPQTVVTMQYYGSHLDLNQRWLDPRDDVIIEQQHCGGNTVIVFREQLSPGTTFSFTSRRHPGYPFSVTIYVNGSQDLRLSTCCESKHSVGTRLGGRYGRFGLVSVENGVPCESCENKPYKEKAKSDLSSETYNKAKLHARQPRLKTSMNGEELVGVNHREYHKTPEKSTMSREKRLNRNQSSSLLNGKQDTVLSRNGFKEPSRGQTRASTMVSREQRHNSDLSSRNSSGATLKSSFINEFFVKTQLNDTDADYMDLYEETDEDTAINTNGMHGEIHHTELQTPTDAQLTLDSSEQTVDNEQLINSAEDSNENIRTEPTEVLDSSVDNRWEPTVTALEDSAIEEAPVEHSNCLEPSVTTMGDFAGVEYQDDFDDAEKESENESTQHVTEKPVEDDNQEIHVEQGLPNGEFIGDAEKAEAKEPVDFDEPEKDISFDKTLEATETADAVERNVEDADRRINQDVRETSNSSEVMEAENDQLHKLDKSTGDLLDDELAEPTNGDEQSNGTILVHSEIDSYPDLATDTHAEPQYEDHIISNVTHDGRSEIQNEVDMVPDMESGSHAEEQDKVDVVSNLTPLDSHIEHQDKVVAGLTKDDSLDQQDEGEVVPGIAADDPEAQQEVVKDVLDDLNDEQKAELNKDNSEMQEDQLKLLESEPKDDDNSKGGALDEDTAQVIDIADPSVNDLRETEAIVSAENVLTSTHQVTEAEETREYAYVELVDEKEDVIVTNLKEPIDGEDQSTIDINTTSNDLRSLEDDENTLKAPVEQSVVAEHVGGREARFEEPSGEENYMINEQGEQVNVEDGMHGLHETNSGSGNDAPKTVVNAYKLNETDEHVKPAQTEALMYETDSELNQPIAGVEEEIAKSEADHKTEETQLAATSEDVEVQSLTEIEPAEKAESQQLGEAEESVISANEETGTSTSAHVTTEEIRETEETRDDIVEQAHLEPTVDFSNEGLTRTDAGGSNEIDEETNGVNANSELEAVDNADHKESVHGILSDEQKFELTDDNIHMDQDQPVINQGNGNNDSSGDDDAVVDVDQTVRDDTNGNTNTVNTEPIASSELITHVITDDVSTEESGVGQQIATNTDGEFKESETGYETKEVQMSATDEDIGKPSLPDHTDIESVENNDTQQLGKVVEKDEAEKTTTNPESAELDTDLTNETEGTETSGSAQVTLAVNYETEEAPKSVAEEACGVLEDHVAGKEISIGDESEALDSHDDTRHLNDDDLNGTRETNQKLQKASSVTNVASDELEGNPEKETAVDALDKQVLPENSDDTQHNSASEPDEIGVDDDNLDQSTAEELKKSEETPDSDRNTSDQVSSKELEVDENDGENAGTEDTEVHNASHAEEIAQPNVSGDEVIVDSHEHGNVNEPFDGTNLSNSLDKEEEELTMNDVHDVNSRPDDFEGLQGDTTQNVNDEPEKIVDTDLISPGNQNHEKLEESDGQAEQKEDVSVEHPTDDVVESAVYLSQQDESQPTEPHSSSESEALPATEIDNKELANGLEKQEIDTSEINANETEQKTVEEGRPHSNVDPFFVNYIKAQDELAEYDSNQVLASQENPSSVGNTYDSPESVTTQHADAHERPSIDKEAADTTQLVADGDNATDDLTSSMTQETVEQLHDELPTEGETTEEMGPEGYTNAPRETKSDLVQHVGVVNLSEEHALEPLGAEETRHEPDQPEHVEKLTEQPQTDALEQVSVDETKSDLVQPVGVVNISEEPHADALEPLGVEETRHEPDQPDNVENLSQEPQTDALEQVSVDETKPDAIQPVGVVNLSEEPRTDALRPLSVEETRQKPDQPEHVENLSQEPQTNAIEQVSVDETKSDLVQPVGVVNISEEPHADALEPLGVEETRHEPDQPDNVENLSQEPQTDALEQVSVDETKPDAIQPVGVVNLSEEPRTDALRPLSVEETRQKPDQPEHVENLSQEPQTNAIEQVSVEETKPNVVQHVSVVNLSEEPHTDELEPLTVEETRQEPDQHEHVENLSHEPQTYLLEQVSVEETKSDLVQAVTLGDQVVSAIPMAEELKENEGLVTDSKQEQLLAKRESIVLFPVLPTAVETIDIASFADRKDVDLSGFELSATQIEELANRLTTKKDVTSIMLRNTTLEDDGLKAIADSLTAKPILKYVNINCNNITANGVKHLVSLLVNNPNIDSLAIHENPIGDEGVETLVTGLLDMFAKLNRQQETTVVTDIETQIETQSQLTDSTAADSDAATFLQSNTKRIELRVLDIGACGMATVGAQSLAKLIAANVGLESLSLTGNKEIGIEGWQSIGEAIGSNTQLQQLELHHNRLGAVGAAGVLLRGMLHNEALESIDLEGNQLSDEDGERIIELLTAAESICHVHVRAGNSMSNEMDENIEKKAKSNYLNGGKHRKEGQE